MTVSPWPQAPKEYMDSRNTEHTAKNQTWDPTAGGTPQVG
jgi:hypothetical protein